MCHRAIVIDRGAANLYSDIGEAIDVATAINSREPA
jgi:hypothetical protein